MANPEYFTLSEFSELPDVTKFSDAQILAAAAYVVGIIERVVSTSFVPRDVTERRTGGCATITLSHAHVLDLTTITANGEDIATAGVSFEGGVLRRDSGASWPGGDRRNVEVTYRAGYSVLPPDDIKAAAMQATRSRLLTTASNAKVSDRTSQISSDGGGTTTFVLAGAERPTGYPEVDAVIIGWRDRLDNFGFA